MTTKKVRSADTDLATEQFSSLNDEFYNLAAPGEYFRFPLHTLLVLAGRPDEVGRLIEEGIEYGPITLKAMDEHSEMTDEEAAAGRALRPVRGAESLPSHCRVPGPVGLGASGHARMPLARIGSPEVARRVSAATGPSGRPS